MNTFGRDGAARLGFWFVFCWALLPSCGAPAPASHLEASSSALTAMDCAWAETGGGASICHATGSSKNPYVLLKTSQAGCIQGHAGHAGDFIDDGDGDCQGVACVPPGAPCGGTTACCSGSCSATGTCACVATGGTCASDADCCNGGTCSGDVCLAGGGGGS